MALASANRVSAWIVEEVTPGTPPATASKTLRPTNFDPKLTMTQLESKELRADRNVAGFRLGSKKGEVAMAMEIMCGDVNTLLEGALGGTFTGTPKVLKNGTSLKYYTIDYGFNDTSQFSRIKGCVVNTCDFDFPVDGLPTISFGIIGLDQDAFQGTRYATSVTAAGTRPPADTYTGTMKEGGSTIAILTSGKVSINNNRDTQSVLGSRVSPGVFEGKFQVKGSITALFQDAALINKYLNETSTTLEFQAKDVNGTDYLKLFLPGVRYTMGSTDIPDNGPVIVNLDFVGLYDGTELSAITVTTTL